MAKEVELDDESREERDAELEAAFAELGSNGAIRWTVYCTGPRDKVGHCATWEDGISLERIAREFGAGEYKVRAIGEDGKMLKGGARTVKVSNNSSYERERQRLATAAPAAAPPQSMGVAELLTFMSAQNQQSMQMMQAMLQAQSSMMTAVLSKPAAPVSNGLGATDVVEMMSNMQNMFKPADASGVDTLLKGIELARSFEGGGSSDGTDFLTLAAKGLDVVSSAMKNDKDKPAQPRVRRVKIRQIREAQAKTSALAKPAKPANVQQPAEVPKGEPVNKKLEWLKAQLKGLVHQAKRDSDPELYAAVLLDNLPDDISDEEIATHFSDASAVTKLSLVNSDVGKYKDWFERFRIAVLEQMTDDGEDGEDSEDGEGEGEDGEPDHD